MQKAKRNPQLQEITELLTELKSRKDARGIDFYEPFEWAKAFHQCQKPFRYVIGSNKVGKTTGAAVEGGRFSLGTHPYRKNIRMPNEGWVVSTDFSKGLEVAQRRFFDFFPKDKIASYEKRYRTLHTTDGCIVRFKSAESGREAFAGANIDWAWVDEECPRDIFTEIVARLVATDGCLWMTIVPIEGMDWTYTDIWDKQGTVEFDTDSQIFSPEIWDNPLLTDVQIKRFMRTLGDDEIQARIYGKYATRSKIIYQELDNILISSKKVDEFYQIAKEEVAM